MVKWALVASIVLLVCTCVFGVLLCCEAQDVRTEYELPHQTRVTIVSSTQDYGFEPNSLTYQVSRGNELACSRRYFGDCDALCRIELGVLIFQGGDLFALHHPDDPFLLHFMCYVPTGELWPWSDGLGGDEPARGVVTGHRLLERIKAATGKDHYRYCYYSKTL